MLQTWVLRFDVFELRNQVLRWTTQPGFLLHAILNARQAGWRPRGSPRASLFIGIAHKAKRGEPLVALIVIGAHALDGLLLRLVNTKTHAETHLLPELHLTTILGAEFLILVHDAVGELLAVQRQHALNPMLGHEVDTAATGYWLPDLHRAMDRARYQGNLTQLVATIGHPWRQCVMLPLM